MTFIKSFLSNEASRLCWIFHREWKGDAPFQQEEASSKTRNNIYLIIWSPFKDLVGVGWIKTFRPLVQLQAGQRHRNLVVYIHQRNG